MKLFLSVYKICFSLGSSFLLFLEKPDNSRCYTFHITWWPWKPVQLDGHLDRLHIDTCGFLNNYTCTCIWNWHDFFKFRVSKCNQSKWPSNCIGLHGHHVMWNSSISYLAILEKYILAKKKKKKKLQRAFRHFSPSTTTLLARKPDHGLAELSKKQMVCVTIDS